MKDIKASLFTILVFLALALPAFSQNTLKFKRLTDADGLSQTNVLAVLHDSQGFMWFCTRDGLNKYDGYNFEIFRHDQNDSTSISGNDIRDIIEDKDGTIWVAAFGGLNRYNREQNNFTRFTRSDDPDRLPTNTVIKFYESNEGELWVGTSQGFTLYDKEKNKFTRFQHDPDDETSLSSNNILSMTEDRQGNFWISTYYGLNKWDKKSNYFKRYFHDPADKSSLPDNRVNQVFIDSRGIMWLCTNGGLSRYVRETDSFVNYVHDENNPEGISHNSVIAIEEDLEGRLWIGTENGGLNIFDVEQEKFTHYQYDQYDNSSLSNNSIYSIYKDRKGSMWVGTYSGGVNFYDRDAKSFDRLYKKPGDDTSLGNNNVYAIKEDSQGNIWIGMDGGGVNKYNPRTGKFTHYLHEKDNPNTIAGNYVLTLEMAGEDKLWLGTWGDGVSVFDTKRNTFRHFKNIPGNRNSLSLDNVMHIYEDRSGGIWISTVGGGLNYYDEGTDRFYWHRQDVHAYRWLDDDFPHSTYEDRFGNLWIGTEAVGVFLYDRDSGSIARFMIDPNTPGSFTGKKVFFIWEDSKDNLWFGTDNGLNKFNYEDSTFTVITEDDGLPSNVVKSMLEDDQGNLWMGTNKGLSKLNPETMTFENYMPSDGIQAYEFNSKSALRASDGKMYFGGVNGINVFDPSQIKDNKRIPPVVFADFRIFNQTVPISAKGSPLPKHINELGELVLSYEHSVFSFDYSALNFTAPDKNQYAYMMEGFDREWNYVGDKRTATYTNLSPGQYTFRVKASNNDGIWNETGKSIRITIVPPYWQTWWFRLLVVIFVIAMGVGFYFTRINQIKRQKNVLEEEVKVRTSEIEEQKEELQKQAHQLQQANDAILAQGKRLETLYNDIQDNIRAAQLIQSSILPAESFIKEYLPESFVLYLPKDVVSGDFYWFNVVGEKIVIAAVDCTGHGVSGAFMSINSHHLLNRAVFENREHLKASDVLDSLNKNIINEMNEENSGSSYAKSGLDIALCVLDRKSGILQYAGANNPLYVVRNGEVIQVKGDKFPIGWNPGKLKRFTNQEVTIKKGDSIYLFSDGYADQIGGESGEKFMYPRFRDLLVEVSALPAEMQCKTLESRFREWKGKGDQLDDILVIGFNCS